MLVAGRYFTKYGEVSARNEHRNGLSVYAQVGVNRIASIASYTEEQAEISIKLKTLQAELEKVSEKVIDSDAFLSTVRKYTRVKKLIPQMLNELIARIDVHQSEKVDGVNIQRLTIHYNCVGTIEILDLPKIPLPEVTLKTRTGVAISYSSSQNTMNF